MKSQQLPAIPQFVADYLEQLKAQKLSPAAVHKKLLKLKHQQRVTRAQAWLLYGNQRRENSQIFLEAYERGYQIQPLKVDNFNGIIYADMVPTPGSASHRLFKKS